MRDIGEERGHKWLRQAHIARVADGNLCLGKARSASLCALNSLQRFFLCSYVLSKSYIV